MDDAKMMTKIMADDGDGDDEGFPPDVIPKQLNQGFSIPWVLLSWPASPMFSPSPSSTQPIEPWDKSKSELEVSSIRGEPVAHELGWQTPVVEILPKLSESVVRQLLVVVVHSSSSSISCITAPRRTHLLDCHL